MKRVCNAFCMFMFLSLLICPIFSAQADDKNFDSPGNMTFSVGTAQFTMIAVKGGSFMMGSESKGSQRDQKPVHKVTLSDFFIGETEVTQELWTAVMGHNPSEFRGTHLPVDTVTWQESHTFIDRLNRMLHDSGQLAEGYFFHLPTEAQWEYAARGGDKSQGYIYAGSNDIEAVAWTKGNAGNRTHPVAGKMPNELGLYDMSGNVWEWVEDFYAPYGAEEQINPIQTDKSSNRVIKRGGSWYYPQDYRFRSTYRYAYYTAVSDSSIGMRLCLSAR